MGTISKDDLEVSKTFLEVSVTMLTILTGLMSIGLFKTQNSPLIIILTITITFAAGISIFIYIKKTDENILKFAGVLIFVYVAVLAIILFMILTPTESTQFFTPTNLSN